jgi:superfamily II DNA or RNA helicase
VITNHLHSVQSRFLSGNDGVDRWSDKQTWDKVLQDIRIVVSTHQVTLSLPPLNDCLFNFSIQVLLSALTHAFVGMARLALLVFDEAHHCISNHPANRIMRDFYHPSQRARYHVPHVLGLTASPIMNNKGGGLQYGTESHPRFTLTEMLQNHRAEYKCYK